MPKDRFAVTFSIYNEAIQPLVDFCAANVGAKVRLKEQMERATARPWARDNFSRWLHLDPERRVEPSYGIGTLLIQIGEELRGER